MNETWEKRQINRIDGDWDLSVRGRASQIALIVTSNDGDFTQFDDQTRKLGIVELHILNRKTNFLSEIKRKCLRQKLLFIFILEK